MILNDNIKLIRELSGLKQEEFARLIKTNVSNLKTYENTNVRPKANILLAVAEIAGVTMDELKENTLTAKQIKINLQQENKNGATVLVDANVSLQDYIDSILSRNKELVDDKQFLQDLIKTNLTAHSAGQQVLYAFARASLELQALTASGGDVNKAKELKDSLSKSLADYKQVDLKDDKAVSVRK